MTNPLLAVELFAPAGAVAECCELYCGGCIGTGWPVAFAVFDSMINRLICSGNIVSLLSLEPVVPMPFAKLICWGLIIIGVLRWCCVCDCDPFVVELIFYVLCKSVPGEPAFPVAYEVVRCS